MNNVVGEMMMKVKFRVIDKSSGKTRVKEFVAPPESSPEQIQSLKSEHRAYWERLYSMSIDEILENF